MLVVITVQQKKSLKVMQTYFPPSPKKNILYESLVCMYVCMLVRVMSLGYSLIQCIIILHRPLPPDPSRTGERHG